MSTQIEGFRDWLVAEFSTIEVIWLHPNAPRPARPYMALQIIADGKLPGQSDYTQIDSEGISTLIVQREAVVSIQIFEEQGDPRAAMNRAVSIQNAIEKRTTRDFFEIDKLSFRGMDAPVDITAMIGNKFEPRASLDVRLGYAATLEDDFGVIERIAGVGTFNGNITIPFEAEV